MKRWSVLAIAVGAFALFATVQTSAGADVPTKPTTGITRPPPWWMPTTTVSTTTTTLPPCPSGACMPVGDVTSNGHVWRQVVAEDFTKPAALGSWGNTTCTDRPIYTGASGTPWMAYPSCYLDTYQRRPYRSDAVLSVHDGMLDFWLHTVDGKPAGANPSPVLPSGSRYQTYGRYSFRARFDTADLSDFYQAFLLWPQNDADGRCAETDFPEARVGLDHVNAFNHWCDPSGVPQPATSFVKTLDVTVWHTYTMQWSPSLRAFSVDGVSIGTTANTWNGPERWQLQIETNTIAPQGQSGHYLVDWAVVYAY